MYYLLFAFRYLILRTERGTLLLRRDTLPVLTLAVLSALPFWLLNVRGFFNDSGFLSRAGSITANLTGFYIAGLVAVAAFSMERAALDDKIETGKVSSEKSSKTGRRFLSRREYVCYIFGYLSILALGYSILSVVITSISHPLSGLLLRSYIIINNNKILINDVLYNSGILLFIIPISHLIITTGYGLYYLVEKMYSKSPKIKPKSNPIPRVRTMDEEH